MNKIKQTFFVGLVFMFSVSLSYAEPLDRAFSHLQEIKKDLCEFSDKNDGGNISNKSNISFINYHGKQIPVYKTLLNPFDNIANEKSTAECLELFKVKKLNMKWHMEDIKDVNDFISFINSAFSSIKTKGEKSFYPEKEYAIETSRPFAVANIDARYANGIRQDNKEFKKLETFLENAEKYKINIIASILTYYPDLAAESYDFYYQVDNDDLIQWVELIGPTRYKTYAIDGKEFNFMNEFKKKLEENCIKLLNPITFGDRISEEQISKVSDEYKKYLPKEPQIYDEGVEVLYYGKPESILELEDGYPRFNCRSVSNEHRNNAIEFKAKDIDGKDIIYTLQLRNNCK